jgi:hypothetical protein
MERLIFVCQEVNSGEDTWEVLKEIFVKNGQMRDATDWVERTKKANLIMVRLA